MGVTPISIYHLKCNRVDCTPYIPHGHGQNNLCPCTPCCLHLFYIHGEFILFVGLFMFTVLHYLVTEATKKRKEKTKKKPGVSGFSDNKQPSLQGLVESNVSWELMAKPPPCLGSSCRILPSLSGFKSTAGQAVLGKNRQCKQIYSPAFEMHTKVL